MRERASVLRAGFWRNRLLLAGFAFELVLVCLMIYVPALARVFEEGPLPLRFWGVLLLYPPVMFFAEEGRKALARRREALRAAGAGDGERSRGGTAATTASGGSA